MLCAVERLTDSGLTHIFWIHTLIIRKKNLLVSVAIQAIVILSGLVMTALLVDYGRQEFRLALFHHARIAASGFSPQQVTNLVNSPKQNRKTVCEPVWERLQKIQQAIPQAIPQLRYIYLMHLVDGQVRFLADSDDPPCSDYSADDGIYAEASTELQNIFATGHPFVEGPLADQWGNWVSGIAPIIDPHSGDVIAVLGVDIDTAVYQQKIAIYRVFGLSITLLTWMLVLKFHFIYRRVRISRDHQAGLNRSLTLEITKRQEVEEALRESENLFRSIFANTAAGIVTVTLEGEIIKANPAFCQFLGYSDTELEQMGHADVTHPDDMEYSLSLYLNVVSYKPERFENEKRYVRKDGVIVWGQITGSWVYDADGSPIYAVVLVLDITERKRSEQEIRESAQQYYAFFEKNYSVMLLVNPETAAIVDANLAACSFYGYTKEELTKKKINEINILSPNQISQEMERAKKEQQQHFHFRHRIASGVIREVEVFSGPVTVGGQKLLYSIVHDITARKQAEEALRSQRELLDNIMNHVPSSIFWKDRNSVYLGCNKAMAVQSGLSNSEEMVGKSDYDLPWKKEEADFFRACDRQVMESGEQIFALEESQQQADGSQATLLTSKVPLRDPDGEVVGLLGIFTDITTRKQAEHALKKSEQAYRKLFQQFQALLNAMPETIMLIDPDMKVVWANSGVLKQFKDCANLQGRHCFNAWQGLMQPCAGCPVQRCFASGENEEQLICDADGRTWAVRAFPLKDGQGEVVNVIDVCSDITEKMRLREEADRNSRLASLGELSAGIAHEINNPNALILLNTPLLQDVFNDAAAVFEHYYQQHGSFELAGLDYQEIRDEIPLLVQRIQDGAIRIKRIVDDLKFFICQGNGDLMDQVDLNEVVQAAIRLLDNMIKKSTDHFETTFAVLPPWRGDFQRIEQVGVNLVHNACQALTDRRQRIYVATYFDAEKKCNVLEVRDEGKGISPELLSRITDPFYTTKRQQGGTGLGLSISERIIREHGGQLEIKSTLEVGTTVKVVLPIAESGAE